MKNEMYPQNMGDSGRIYLCAGCKEPCPEHKIGLSIAIDGFGKGSNFQPHLRTVKNRT